MTGWASICPYLTPASRKCNTCSNLCYSSNTDSSTCIKREQPPSPRETNRLTLDSSGLHLCIIVAFFLDWPSSLLIGQDNSAAILLTQKNRPSGYSRFLNPHEGMCYGFPAIEIQDRRKHPEQLCVYLNTCRARTKQFWHTKCSVSA